MTAIATAQMTAPEFITSVAALCCRGVVSAAARVRGGDMSRVSRIMIRRFRYGGIAECEGCDLLHPDSARERCRAHARATGHKVRFLVEDVTTYERETAPEAATTKED